MVQQRVYSNVSTLPHHPEARERYHFLIEGFACKGISICISKISGYYFPRIFQTLALSPTGVFFPRVVSAALTLPVCSLWLAQVYLWHQFHFFDPSFSPAGHQVSLNFASALRVERWLLPGQRFSRTTYTVYLVPGNTCCAIVIRASVNSTSQEKTSSERSLIWIGSSIY